MKIAFYVNESKAAAKSAHAALASEAKAIGLKLVDGRRADVIIVLGGDGTLLKATHEFPEIPVLGFNLGGLGYLSGVGPKDFSKALKMLADGRFTVSERTRLEVRKHGAHKSFLALNDVVIMREMTGHAAVLDVSANANSALRYTADGIIVATPTGSTAYSLSAGGPVMMRGSGVLTITPTNPHSLWARPLVVRDDVKLSITSRRRVNGRAERLGVYVDGEPVFMLGGDESLHVCKAKKGACIVELNGYDPYVTLSNKLGWQSGDR